MAGWREAVEREDRWPWTSVGILGRGRCENSETILSSVVAPLPDGSSAASSRFDSSWDLLRPFFESDAFALEEDFSFLSPLLEGGGSALAGGTSDVPVALAAR